MIQSLRSGSEPEQRLYRDFIEARRLTEAMSAFAHVNGPDGGCFPLTGIGDVNTYALFAETIQKINAESGRAGFIVPTGIATDDSTKAFFASLPEKHRLVSLYDFENREKIFEAVDSRMKFCLITLGPSEAAQFAFFLLNTEELEDARRCFTLSAEDFALINPNTRTCPVFRSQADAELTKKIYRQVPVLIKEARNDLPEVNPWGISFSAMFHMSGDSGLFLDLPEPGTLPLYEAKMMHQFDHRWATYYWESDKNGYDSRDITPTEKADPSYAVRPRYWVQEREVIARIARAPKCIIQAWLARDGEALRKALANWIESANEVDLLDGLTQSTARDRVIEQGGPTFESLPKKEKDWFDPKAINEARNWPPLSESELEQIRAAESLDQATTEILDQRSPRWLMGWRDICRGTDERTVIASVIPRVGVGNKIPLFFPREDARLCACLLSNMGALVYDFVARQKIGGVTMNYFLFKQLPVLPPERYTEADLDYIVPRVLELTYNSHDLAPWAADLGYTGEPFGFDPERRARLRAELDAYYANLYGLTDEELQYILDPIDTHGEGYPSRTFPGLKKNDIKNHGHYRTRGLVLKAWKNFKREPVEAETVEPQELRIPDFPRKPNTESEILIYGTALLYAWFMQAGGPVRIRELGRALSLLKAPERLVENAPAEHAELAKQWSKSFKESIEHLTLRLPIEEIRKRGQLRFTRDDRNEFLLSLQEDARPQNIPQWVALDAGLSLEAARHELNKEPSLADEIEELESVDAYLAQLTPQP